MEGGRRMERGREEGIVEGLGAGVGAHLASFNNSRKHKSLLKHCNYLTTGSLHPLLNPIYLGHKTIISYSYLPCRCIFRWLSDSSRQHLYVNNKVEKKSLLAGVEL